MPTRADDYNAIRDIPLLYARAVDRRDFPLFQEFCTDDCVIFGPQFRFEGVEQVMAGMTAVENYKLTFHVVHNHLLTVDGDQAIGEVYCVASHLYDLQEGEATVERKLDWGIRYMDRYRRLDNRWCLSERELILDWTQELATGN